MNRFAVMLFLASGALLGLSGLYRSNAPSPSLAILLLIALAAVPLATLWNKTKLRSEDEAKTEALMAEAHRLTLIRREVRSKIPKSKPRQDSQAAYEGSTKLVTARSMAAMIRKARLRQVILEICDFGDMILETIRRMPQDTPAAVVFSNTHLQKLTEALERCFEMSKDNEYRNAPPSVDAQEIECFSTFITAFKKQQDTILFESHTPKE